MTDPSASAPAATTPSKPDECAMFYTDANGNGIIDKPDFDAVMDLKTCSASDGAAKIMEKGRNADGTHAHYYMIGEYHVVVPVAQTCAMVDAIATESQNKFAFTLEWSSPEAQAIFDRFRASAKTEADRSKFHDDLVEYFIGSYLSPKGHEYISTMDWSRIQDGDREQISNLIENEENLDGSKYPKELANYEELINSQGAALRQYIPYIAMLDRVAAKGGDIYGIDVDEDDEEKRESGMTAKMQALGSRYAYILGHNGAAHVEEHGTGRPSSIAKPMASRLAAAEGDDKVLSISMMPYMAQSGFAHMVGNGDVAGTYDLYWLQSF